MFSGLPAKGSLQAWSASIAIILTGKIIYWFKDMLKCRSCCFGIPEEDQGPGNPAERPYLQGDEPPESGEVQMHTQGPAWRGLESAAANCPGGSLQRDIPGLHSLHNVQ